jgi:hypothetical protein
MVRAALACAFAALIAAVGCGSSSQNALTRPASHSAARVPAQRKHERAPAAAPSSASAAVVSLRATVDASARLPQTHAFPGAASRQFKALMAALWSGIAAGSPSRAAVAFLPKDAYVRLKAIAGAGEDWENRLFHDYALDVAAAHALLGSGASRARLLGVRVPAAYGHWVEPGVCYNAIGYYELPNARVVYSENGITRSFGIASMISWRGEWYVVHLGAVLRETDAGTVDEPALGAGQSSYSGTC